MTTEATEEQILAAHESKIRALVKWLRGQGYRSEPVEDMRQDARLVLLTRARNYREGYEAELWTYARPRIVGHFKDQARKDCRGKESSATPPDAPQPFAGLSVESIDILRAFARLRQHFPRSAEILYWRYFRGLGKRQIERKLRIRWTTLDRELERGQEFLRAALSKGQ